MTHSVSSLVQLEGIGRTYRTDTVETAALRDLSLDIEAGEFVAVRGPSGCGKSTLLNIVGLLDRPTSGSYRFAGVEVGDLGEAELAELRRRRLGFIFQSFQLLDELTVRENVEFALFYHKLKASERKARALEVMERMQIAHRAGHRPSQLSGGQQQRVAVARAVVGKPDLVLADEPTGNLDSANGSEVMDILSELNRQGTTILMVTHSADHSAYARRDICLADGQLVSGQPGRGNNSQAREGDKA